MHTFRCTDLGLTARDMEYYLVTSGYWGDASLRERNRCVLSPGALSLSTAQCAALDELSRTTHRALRSVSKRIHTLARTTSISNADAAFLKVVRRAARSLLLPGEIEEVPPVVKLDLVLDDRGAFKVVEVDAYNPRGYGYLSLMDALVPSGLRVGEGIPGLAARMRRISGSAPWHCIVPEFEQYYEPAFGILARSLASEGVCLHIVREQAVAEGVPVGTYLFSIPDSLHRYPTVREMLMARYRAGALHTLFPPRAYLGTKALLPTLRDAGAVHIPKTALVSRMHDPLGEFQSETLLKGVVSSGMKQVIFSDIHDSRFSDAYREARTAKVPQWIMQEQIVQRPLTVPVFDRDGAIVTAPYYLRVIAYATAEGLLGAEVTGRPDRMVHGAPDCIQIPVVRM